MMNKTNKAEITYPTLWEYLIVTSNADSLKAAIEERFQMLDYKLTFSKSSKEGKYQSFTLSLQVISQKERDEIFEILSNIQDVKIVV